MEVVLHEVRHFAELKLCHDIAWVFESSLYCYNPDWMEVVEAWIGRCHIYGHEYWCPVLCRLLHTANYSLMVHEEPDHLWYMMQHVIRWGSVCSRSRGNAEDRLFWQVLGNITRFVTMLMESFCRAIQCLMF
jgi:hypothetical protein